MDSHVEGLLQHDRIPARELMTVIRDVTHPRCRSGIGIQRRMEKGKGTVRRDGCTSRSGRMFGTY